MTTTVDSILVSFNDQVSAGAAAAAASLDKLTAAQEKTNTASATTDTTITRSTRSWQSWAASGVDPAAQAAARIEKAQRDAAASTAALNQALANGTVSATGFVQQQANIAATLAQRTQAAQAAAERQETLRQADDSGSTSSGALAKAQTNLAGSHGQVALSAGAASAATRNLSIQGIQFFSGIATGQPVLTSFIQQGHQVADSMLAGGQGVSALLSPLKSLVGAIVTPTGAAVALVAGLAALGYSAESTNAQLVGFQNTLRATRGDATDVATLITGSSGPISALLGISKASAQAAAAVIAGSSGFTGGQAALAQYATVAKNLSVVLDEDLTAAAGTVAAALRDPQAVAKQMAGQDFPGFTLRLADTVHQMQAAGNAAGAAALVIDTLKASTDGAKDHLTPLQTALRDLDNVFIGADGHGKGLAATIGQVVVQSVTGVIMEVTALIKRLEQLNDIAHKAVDLPATSPTAAMSGADPDVQQSIKSASARFGLDPNFVSSIQALEGVRNSDGSFQTSSAGAVGAMQVMPGTFSDMASKYGITGSATNLDSNVMAGAAYLRQLLDQFHDAGLAAAAYNAGPNAVSSGRDLPAETQAYVQNFRSLYNGQAITGPIGGAGGGVSSVPDRSSNAIVVSASSAAQDNNSFSTLQSVDPNSLQRQALTAKQSALQQGFDSADADKNTALANQYAEALSRVKGQLTDLQSPADAYVRSLQDQAKGGAALYDGDAKLVEVQQHLAEIERSNPGSVTPATEAAAEAAALASQSNEYRKQVAAIELSVDAQDKMTAAYGQGNEAVVYATAQTSAYQAAIKLFPPGTEAARVAQVGLTQEYLRSAEAAATLQTAQQNAQSRDNLTYIQTETDSLGTNEAAREKLLATLKAEQDMHRKFGAVLPQEGKDYIDLAGRVSDATVAYQAQQASLSELSSFTSQTFDTISQAITSAFATGSLKAIDFGSIVKSVISSAVAEIAKLAILNPVLNTLFGQNNVTLGSVGGALGSLLGNGTGGSSASSGSGLLGSIFGSGSATSASGINFDSATQGSAANDNSASSGATSGGLLGNGTGVLGSKISGSDLLGGLTTLAAVGGLVSGKSSGVTPSQVLSVAGYAYKAASFAFPQTTSAVTGALTDAVTPTINSVGTSLGLISASGDGISTAAATAGQTVSIAAADSFATATGTAATAASSLASALPLLGVAVGIITDLVTGNLRGAAFVATGAAGGAAIGSAFGPAGTVIGAAIGAVVGGFIDTFFPQHPKNPYSNTQIDAQDGHLTQGDTVSQLIDTSGTQAGVDQFNNNFNAFLDSLNLTITNANGVVANIGQNIKGLPQITSPDQVLKYLDFTSTDRTSNFGIAAASELDGQRFDTTDQFTGFLQQVAGFADRMTALGVQIGSLGPAFKSIGISSVSNPNADGSNADLYTALNADLSNQVLPDETALNTEINRVNQFVNGTMPSLVNPVMAVIQGPVQAGLMKLQQQYVDAIVQAQAFGLSIDGLSQGFNAAVSEYLAPALAALGQETQGIVARGDAATGDQEDADLINYDVQAAKERVQYSTDVLDVYGPAFAATQQYADMMTQLENVQGEERAAIAKKYSDQVVATEQQAAQQAAAAIAAAQGNVVSLFGDILSYTDKLETSSASPLSPTAQYDLASSKFTATAQAAAGGDYTAAGNLTSYADTFLTASQAVNGSGAQYAADFQSVLGALANVTTNSDALTNSALFASTEDQTTKLSDVILQVRDEVAALRAEVQQQGLNPRLAA